MHLRAIEAVLGPATRAIYRLGPGKQHEIEIRWICGCTGSGATKNIVDVELCPKHFAAFYGSYAHFKLRVKAHEVGPGHPISV